MSPLLPPAFGFYFPGAGGGGEERGEGWLGLGRRAVEVERLMECLIIFIFIIDF